MIGNFTANEFLQIDLEVTKQVNQITHKAFLMEQQEMINNGEQLPQDDEIHAFVMCLRFDVVNHLIKSN